VSNAPSYAAVVTPHLGERHLNLLNTHVHLDVHPYPARHVDRISLRSAWVELSLAVVIKNYLDPSPDPPFDSTYFQLKAATFKILINDKLSPGGSLLAA